MRSSASKVLAVLGILSLLAVDSFGASTERLQRLIADALNSQPQEWVTPILPEDIHISGAAGRADINKKSKFSYYIHFDNPQDERAKITLIPMATSRYAPTYYQTDEWWDAHKTEIDKAKAEGAPVPRQDASEVKTWLQEMKLSTNPLVFEIAPGGSEPTLLNSSVSTIRLQDFLTKYYLQTFSENGFVTLFRGGEKPTETAEWQAGRKPRGVRYWTPTATYAWRYARKNPQFLEELVQGKAPLYVFKLTNQQFIEMTSRRRPQLTLGTELTKRAHDNFDRNGRFIDHLLGQTDYMGVGEIGVEFEVRSNSLGASNMVPFFEHPIRVEELIHDRVLLLEKTLARLLRARPQEVVKLKADYQARIEQARVEGMALLAIQNKMARETVENIMRRWNTSLPPEIANVDKIQFRDFVNQKLADLPSSQPFEVMKQIQKLDRILWEASGMSCSKLF